MLAFHKKENKPNLGLKVPCILVSFMCDILKYLPWFVYFYSWNPRFPFRLNWYHKMFSNKKYDNSYTIILSHTVSRICIYSLLSNPHSWIFCVHRSGLVLKVHSWTTILSMWKSSLLLVRCEHLLFSSSNRTCLVENSGFCVIRTDY